MAQENLMIGTELVLALPKPVLPHSYDLTCWGGGRYSQSWHPEVADRQHTELWEVSVSLFGIQRLTSEFITPLP